MKILILPDNKYLSESADAPEEGRRYILEDAAEHTENQHRAAEALIGEYWKSGLHAKYGGDPKHLFRDKLKRDLGDGFESYVYADVINGKAKIFQVKKYTDIPEHVRQDPDLAEMVQGKIKSLSRYGKKALARFIDNLIDDGTAAGVKSAKWFEIIDGLRETALEKEKGRIK